MVHQKDCVGGTFVKVADQAYIDFLIKCGISKDQAQPILNTKWTQKWFQTSPNVWTSHVTCPGAPQFNSLETFAHNQEKEIPFPFFGPGKFKFKLECKEDGFLITAPETPFGPFEVRDKFDEGGNTVTTVAKEKGVNFVARWERKVSNEGWFRYEKSEGLENYLKVVGMPAEAAEGVKNYRLKVTKNGNTFTHVEHFGDHKMINKVTLDEECDYEIMPGMVRRLLITQLDSNSYLWLIRNKEGTQKEEGKMTFTEEGTLWVSLE